MDYLIGTDIGTSGTKTILMDTKGRLIAQDLQEYDILTPKPLWAEQWPDVWFDAVCKSIRNCVDRAKVGKDKIKGICISGLYGGSGIPLDEDLNPVRPCIIWMDRRAEEQEKWAEKHIGIKRLKQITHNGADSYYGYTKILWIKENEPENWAKIKVFLPPNSYVIYKLTGEIAIDYSSAGNLGGLFDMNKREWSYKLLYDMGIPYSMMPQRIAENTKMIGSLKNEVAAKLGLLPNTAVFNGGVDCGAATLGLGVFEPGEYAAAIGTSMCAALIHSDPVAAENLIEWPYVFDPKHLTYSFGGGCTAGAIVKWFKKTFAELEMSNEESGGKSAYAQLDEQADKIPCGSDGLVVLPYFMGERSPLWDINAKGVIFGLSLIHTKAHVYRAFLEAIAYSLRHTMEACGTVLNESILVAGGVSKSKLWLQIIADVTGHSVVCPKNGVEANLGDVMLAGLGTGLLTTDELKTWQILSPKIEPDAKAHKIYDKYYEIYRNLYLHLKTDMQDIDRIRK